MSDEENKIVSIGSLSKQFKDQADLMQYAEAQQKTIIELSKKIAALESDNKHLSEKVVAAGITVDLSPSPLDVSDEEIICITQLRLLKDRSVQRELNLDEARRFNIYVDILENIKEKKIKTAEPLKNTSDDDLMKLVKSE